MIRWYGLLVGWGDGLMEEATPATELPLTPDPTPPPSPPTAHPNRTTPLPSSHTMLHSTPPQPTSNPKRPTELQLSDTSPTSLPTTPLLRVLLTPLTDSTSPRCSLRSQGWSPRRNLLPTGTGQVRRHQRHPRSIQPCPRQCWNLYRRYLRWT